MYKNYLKRTTDVFLSIIAIIIFSPLLILTAFLVWVKMGSPVIFRQERPGMNEIIFTIYKFRTMNDNRDDDGMLLPETIRLTRFGKFLRSTSLDELPELFNVLKGDMSIVGPRPLLVQYLPLYNAYQKRRHEVRPGITGLAQVSGRNAISWEDRLNLDVQYVDTINSINDLRIILLTVKKVIVREGIDSDTAPTMELFTGDIEGRVNI